MLKFLSLYLLLYVIALGVMLLCAETTLLRGLASAGVACFLKTLAVHGHEKFWTRKNRQVTR